MHMAGPSLGRTFVPNKPNSSCATSAANHFHFRSYDVVGHLVVRDREAYSKPIPIREV